jgi:hypothetical protein
MLHGVDVSGYQSGWTPGSSDAFVFIKATEGRTVVSKTMADQAKAARAKKLQVGFYHFLWPNNAKEQAAWFASHLSLQPGDLLVCDFENTKGGHPSAADAAAFIAEVKRLKPGHKVGLYCNKSDWTTRKPTSGDFLWIATWGTTTAPTTNPAWAFWQYSDSPIDQNRASPRWATLAELKAWAGGSDPVLYPTPKTNDVYLSKLRLGQTDSDSVWHLQNALKLCGWEIDFTGNFDKRTAESVARQIFSDAASRGGAPEVTIHNDL